MLQVSKTGLLTTPSPESLKLLGEQFKRQNYILLPGFLEPRLLRFIQEKIHDGDFYERSHGGIGTELCLTKNIAHSLLYFLLNDSKLFQVFQSLTGCEPIGSFEGRVYRTVPSCGHHDEWHNDMSGHRLIAISINLSTDIFSGGMLQIRDYESKRVVQEVANIGFGNAVVFRLSHELQHRISDIEGNVPKTAFAGWFKSQPSFLSIFKGSGTDQ
jgi:hypothetical protein